MRISSRHIALGDMRSATPPIPSPRKAGKRVCFLHDETKIAR
jgi:hypothetical protein